MVKKGFTITEIVIVLMVIGTIMTIVIKGSDIFHRANIIHVFETINSMLTNADLSEKFHYDNFGVTQEDYNRVVLFFAPDINTDNVQPDIINIRYIVCNRIGAIQLTIPPKPYLLTPIISSDSSNSVVTRSSGCLEFMSKYDNSKTHVPIYPNSYAVCQFESMVDDRSFDTGKATVDINNSLSTSIISVSRNFRACPSSLRNVPIGDYYYITLN